MSQLCYCTKQTPNLRGSQKQPFVSHLCSMLVAPMAPYHMSSQLILRLSLKELFFLGKPGFPKAKDWQKHMMPFEASARDKTYVMSARILLAKINHVTKPGVSRARDTPSTQETLKVTLLWMRVYSPLRKEG